MSIKRIFILVFIYTTTLVTQAQIADSCRVAFRFRPRQDMFWEMYGSNKSGLKKILSCIDKHKLKDGSIKVVGYSDGDIHENMRRCNRVKTALITRKGIKERHFKTYNLTETYHGVNNIVLVDFCRVVNHADIKIPYRDDSEYEGHDVQLSIYQPTLFKNPNDTIAHSKCDTTRSDKPIIPKASRPIQLTPHIVKMPENSNSVDSINSTYKPLFALKTNLLFDAVLAPNIELERWIGRKQQFSIMAETWFPWYRWHNNERAYEIFYAGGELRWWFKRKQNNISSRPLTGHFLGAYAGGGLYDLEWNTNGHQGEYFTTGLTYGYACHLTRNFNLEFSISAGYVGGPYRSYEAHCNNELLVWCKNSNFNYFGPTKAKVSLVWILGTHKKERR